MKQVQRAISFVGLLVALALSQSAIADSSVARGPEAPWVEILDVPAPDPLYADRIQGGLHYLLSEYQIQPTEGGWETYNRIAYKIVDRTGLESAASISLEFDPEAETVTLNRLNIIRDGEIIDQRQVARIQTARREPDAERGVFDGRLTAYINLDDVRIGDIIDWASTSRHSPAVGKHLFYAAFEVEWTVPVGRFRVKAFTPPGRELVHTSRETKLQADLVTEGGIKALVWDVINPEPINDQPNAPADFPVQGRIEISSTRDWADIVAAVRPHYQLNRALPKTFQTKLASIANRYASAQDRLIEAMRIVQDDIRYVSLSIGTGTYIPRSPEEVIASGFGDCKDKSLLLAIALRSLGIEADVALTHSFEGAALLQRLPAVSVFNHAIVRARIDGKPYWIDPTNYLQGGRADTIVVPQFAYALPLTDDTAALEPIPRPRLVEPTSSVLETFDMPHGEEPMTLHVETTYRADSADWMRYKLMSESPAKLSNNYLKYYDGLYPGISRVAALDVSDDRDANVVKVVERYELSAAKLKADGLIKEFPLKADIALGDFPTPSSVDRVAPVWIGQPVFKQHTTLVRNLKARFRAPENSAQDVAPFAALTAVTKATDTSFQVIWTFMTFTDRVSPAYLSRYSKRLDDFWANSKWTFDFTYVAKPGE
ncbi:DUF3857 domain-containing transglutaminase family protein [Mesorhizobium sp. J428]|uniref:DUF3857 domain-containing transglutaminase family protein n=1 Tax=Mesorhizobium sp. J428 TaxID=2898440 RepID=UPI0021515221|nr:DUF3857 domain-containing transglutaminase family protein [Mesorhizobium sp. J428]MCR5857042.1 DUF3857 domain-containing transglutaminase family protein [Mesorhizobium sp. J428]